MRRVFEKSLAEAEELLRLFRQDRAVLDSLVAAGVMVANAFRSGNRVLACGNGGSLADAMHFAEEWSGRFRKDRVPYPALALSDATHMSCVANDYGFEHVFSRQVQAFGRQGDVLLLLSTSGNSPSIIRAAAAAKGQDMRVLGFLGKGGGEVVSLCDTVVMAPGGTSDRIQELHMLALHALIEAVEIELGHV